MASGYWSPVAIASAAGPTNTSLTIASPVTCFFTFPPNAIAVGSQIRIAALGQISNVTTSPGTIKFQVASGSTIIHDCGTIALNPVTQTTIPFELTTELTVRSVGSGTSATVIGKTRVASYAITGATVTAAATYVASVSSGPLGAPAVGSGFDSTVAWPLYLYGGPSLTSGAVTIQTMTIETGGVALT